MSAILIAKDKNAKISAGWNGRFSIVVACRSVNPKSQIPNRSTIVLRIDPQNLLKSKLGDFQFFPNHTF